MERWAWRARLLAGAQKCQARQRPAPGERPRAPRTAFVLSGGGNQGVMQVGMLRALLEPDAQAKLAAIQKVSTFNRMQMMSAPLRDAAVAGMVQTWKRSR